MQRHEQDWESQLAILLAEMLTLKGMTYRRMETLIDIFGLDGREPMTLEAAAAKYGTSYQSVQQVKDAAMNVIVTQFSKFSELKSVYSGHMQTKNNLCFAREILADLTN